MDIRLLAGIFYLSFGSNLICCKPSSGKNTIEDATVEIISRRYKRSVNVHNQNGTGHDNEIDVKVTAFGVEQTFSLTSQPKGSVVSDKFRLNRIYTSEDGNILWEDVTPLQHIIIEIEEKLYTDIESGTSVLLEHSNDGTNVSMTGIINQRTIRKKRSIDSNGKDHEIESNAILPEQHVDKNEVADYDVPEFDEGPETRGLMGGVTEKPKHSGRFTALIEIGFVVDYKTTVEIFKKDRQKMLEYYAILVNSVNNKYSLGEQNPAIKCRMVSLLMIETLEGQPFVNIAKQNDGKYDIHKIHEQFSEWAYTNKNNLGLHDVLPLMLGVEMNSRTAGLATVGGACLSNDQRRRNYASLVAQDLGSFRGEFVLAHEVAHSLGSPHDGSKDQSETCTWEEGYIMSYEGWGNTKHWKLSNCSRALIKNYLSGTDCAFQSTSQQSITSQNQIGEKLTRAAICKLQGKDWTPLFQTPDQMCRFTACQFGHTTSVVYQTPGDNFPCGNGGKCLNGYCIGQKTKDTLSLDQLCVKVTNEPTAKWDDADGTYTKCGKGLTCAYKRQVPGGIVSGRRSVSNMPADPGSPCEAGKVCDGTACVNDENTGIFQCMKHTHQSPSILEHIVQPSMGGCKGGVICVVDKFFEEPLVKPSGHKCGKHGTCVSGVCMELTERKGKHSSSSEFVNSVTKINLIQICRKFMSAFMNGTEGVTVEQPLNRDEYCSNLKCRNNDDQPKPLPDPTPNGVVCGAFRVCKAGKCVPCNELKRD